MGVAIGQATGQPQSGLHSHLTHGPNVATASDCLREFSKPAFYVN